MTYVLDAIHNQVLMTAIASWFTAQLLKVIIDAAKNGFSAERLTGSGGMPSSHSATVTGLAVSTAMVYGCGGFEFAMAFFFAFIVMYDAAGVRRETGEEAKILNKLRRRDIKEGKEPLADKDLREQIGHNLIEIVAGILIGIVCAIVMNIIL